MYGERESTYLPLVCVCVCVWGGEGGGDHTYK